MTPIIIVAHPKRTELVTRLAEEVKPDAVVWDNDNQGGGVTHLRAWEWHADDIGVDEDAFKVVLEDDARPVSRFHDQLDRVLAVAPADVVSLYLGTGYPKQWQDSLRTAVAPIGRDPHFLTAPALLGAVAYAVRVRWIDHLVLFLRDWAPAGVPIDKAITRFCRVHNITVAYSRPSIVQHLDGPPLITERLDGEGRTLARRAWKVGIRPVWEASAEAISEPKLLYVDGNREFFETRRKEYL